MMFMIFMIVMIIGVKNVRDSCGAACVYYNSYDSSDGDD